MEKAVLYVRVSSKEQSEKGYSIPAQRKLLRDYAEKQRLHVVREFEEVESAKTAGRSEFEKMVEYLRRNPDVGHILVEKTDRLTRNFRDEVKIDDLKRTVHFVKEGEILGENAKSNARLMHGIKVVLARQYIENLAEETSKGMLAKAQEGLYPSWAPLGYVNNKETKGIEIDFTRAGTIRELFEEYSLGTLSLQEVTRMAKAKGLRSRKGRPLCVNQIGNMLKNPIYIGDFIWRGGYHTGKHKGIVSGDVFERVQEIRKSKGWTRGAVRPFAFRGLVRCGYCGGVLTPFRAKGKYVYYWCTKYRGKCPEKGIREERLVELLAEPLMRLRMTEERLGWMKQALSQSLQDEKAFAAEERRRLQGESEEIEGKINALYEDKLSRLVDAGFWKRKYGEYRRRLECIEERLARHRRAGANYLEQSNRILELAEKAYSLFLTQDNLERRKLVNLLLSNLVLKGGKLSYKFREPFDSLADGIEGEAKEVAEKVPAEARNKNWLLR